MHRPKSKKGSINDDRWGHDKYFEIEMNDSRKGNVRGRGRGRGRLGRGHGRLGRGHGRGNKSRVIEHSDTGTKPKDPESPPKSTLRAESKEFAVKLPPPLPVEEAPNEQVEEYVQYPWVDEQGYYYSAPEEYAYYQGYPPAQPMVVLPTGEWVTYEVFQSQYVHLYYPTASYSSATDSTSTQD